MKIVKKLLLLLTLLFPIIANAATLIDGIYYNLKEDQTAEVTYKNGMNYSGNVVIPSSVAFDGVFYEVTSIGDFAFYLCSSLTSVTIPNSVTSIGMCAFEFSGLTSIIIPSSVTSIGKLLFSNCSALNSIMVDSGNPVFDSRSHCNAIIETSSNTLIAGCKNTIIPYGVTSIGDGAFYSCTSLASVSIPNSVTSIGGQAFALCYNLTSVTISNSVKSIGKEAFSFSSINSIIIPSNVSSIGQGAFTGCSSLDSIVVDVGNSVFDSRNHCNAIIVTSSNTLIAGCKNTVIPYGVTSIGEDAFSGHSYLTSITIPNTVTSIEGWAFENTGLTSIIIPNSVSSIGISAFFGCSNLTSVTVWNPLPVAITNKTFTNSANATLYVPTGSKSAYASTSYWKNFKVIRENALFPDCPDGEMRDAAFYLFNMGIVQGENGLLIPNRNVTRAEVAKTSLYGVYKGVATTPATLPSDHYPCVYDDLQDYSAYYFRPARALLYLEYGDGVAPFDHNRLDFAPEDSIARVHVLKVLMETFNIQPDLEGTGNPFPNDANVAALAQKDHRAMGYIRRAADLGIITKANDMFRPFAFCTRGEAFVMLYRIMKAVETGTITDPNPQESDYFEPLNITLKTIAQGVGMNMGNFSHYTKSSFALSGTVPLTFAHTYNSYNTTLPEVFYGVNDNGETYQPLGDGWSHNYHSFISIPGGLNGTNTRLLVHWGGGSMDVYKSNGSTFVPESYGVYDTYSLVGNEIVITTKSQTEYHFSAQGGSGGGYIYYLSSVKDRNGNTLTLTYETGVNGMKRIKSVSDGNRSLSFSYKSGTNLLASVSDPLGRNIKFGYSFNNLTQHYQLKTFTDAKGQVTHYDYGDESKISTSKLLTEIQLPKGNYIRNQYDANRRLTQTKNGTSQTDISVNTNYGGSYPVTSRVDVTRNGSNTSTYNYQFNTNNVVTSMSGPKQLNVTNTYYSDTNKCHLPKTITTNNTNISNIAYDEKGNVKSFSVSGDGTTLTTTMTYDSMNNLTSITDPKGYTTTYSYDSNGNLTGVSAPESVTTSIEVNSKGLTTSVTNPMGVVTQFAYNSYGNLTKTTLPALSLSSTATYDGASRLKSSTDALGRTTSFVYDDNDNLTSETDPASHTTSFDYDSNDNLTDITNAKGGVTSLSYDNATDWLTSVSFAGATREYEYNDDGTVDSYTKPDGTTLSYSYDDLGRVTNDGVNSYSYDNKLRLSSISGNGMTMAFSYDGFNRITGTSCNGHSNNYSYDKNGNCTSINNTSYSYDKLNRLTSVSFSGKTISYIYRKDGQLSKVTYPNGMTTTYGYDAVGRLTSKTTKLSNGAVIAGYNFTLDKVGNITQQTTQEPYSNINLVNEDISYSYNSGNRITKAGDIYFSFDANGNTTKRGSESYNWDESDRLVRAGSTNIEYDPLGLIASYGNITFTTDPLGIGNVLSDSKSGAEYVYGNGLEARILNGVVSYYVTDVRGSVVAIVDDIGNITHKYQYDEFGKVTQKEEADYNPFQYTGKYGVMYLSDHLYYMRTRHYDPTIGRFLSEDPIWSTNLYPYADNNPIMGMDPEGLKTKEIMRDIAIKAATKGTKTASSIANTSKTDVELVRLKLSLEPAVASKDKASAATTINKLNTPPNKLITPAYAPVNTAIGIVKTAQTNDPSYYFQGIEDDFWGAAAAGAAASGHPVVGAGIYLVHDVDKGIKAGDPSLSLAENYKRAEDAGSATFWIINRVGDFYDNIGITNVINSYYMNKYNK